MVPIPAAAVFILSALTLMLLTLAIGAIPARLRRLGRREGLRVTARYMLLGLATFVVTVGVGAGLLRLLGTEHGQRPGSIETAPDEQSGARSFV